MAERPQLRLVTLPAARAPSPRSAPARPPRRGSGRIVAMGGGKGGVGKSLVTANVGIELARLGRRVVLVDCDLGGANLHTCLGIDPPRRTLSDFVKHGVRDLAELYVPAGLPNLFLVSGALDDLDAANPVHSQKMRFIRNLMSIEADHVILDLAAGTQKNTLDFFLVADHKVVVLVPEHGSVENAHRFLKAAYWRGLDRATALFGAAPLLREILSARRFRGPHEVLAAIQEADAETGRQLREQMEAFRPAVVVNQVRTPADEALGSRIALAWRHVGVSMEVLGTIEHDEEVWRAARERRPLLPARSPGRAARSIGRIAARLLELDAIAEAAR